MALLKIVQYPSKKLKRIGLAVTQYDDELQSVVDSMFQTHYATPHCAALAATQLDMKNPWRITVIDYSLEKNQPLCLINPEIIAQTGEQYEYEGCMSVYPHLIEARVKRAQQITVRAQDRQGKTFELTAQGFLAKCIQHEIDHLNGLLFIDRLNKIKQAQIKQKITHHLKQLKKK